MHEKNCFLYSILLWIFYHINEEVDRAVEHNQDVWKYWQDSERLTLLQLLFQFFSYKNSFLFALQDYVTVKLSQAPTMSEI